MYTTIKNVQVVIALLKQYQINQVVISPGGNNIPIIHSIESDNFFYCYSVVDERSAAYFAMGMAQQLEKTVALVCTSGTAVSNYLPGLTEAKYQRVPVVAITSDRSPYLLNQLETQKIDQMNIFSTVCKKDVNLPIVNTDDDMWYCGRLVNEALIAASSGAKGPVHINVPTTGSPFDYSCEVLPTVKKIDYISSIDDFAKSTFEKYAQRLSNKKVLVVYGENFENHDDLVPVLRKFAEKTKAVCIMDYISNIHDADAILSYRITESMRDEDFDDLCPDIVITIGNNILSNNLKRFMRSRRQKVEHWAIDEGGEIRDVFKSLSAEFCCSPKCFLEAIMPYLHSNEDGSYQAAWDKARSKTKIKDFPYSNMGIIEKLKDAIPEHSVVHLAILNSTRGFHLFEHQKGLKVYSNIGALGIDGCMSTFMGQSRSTDQLSFLIVGDLSFFYDMNSLGIRGIPSNVRILLLNNGGGGEFHYNMGKSHIPTLNDYISVEHSKTAKGWVESLGFMYFAVRNFEELNAALEVFASRQTKPVVIEAFTEMEDDAKHTKDILKSVSESRNTSTMIKGKIKNILKF